MVIRLTHLLAVVACILSLHSFAFAQTALPSNLHVTPIYRSLVESIAHQSPTFRAQLLRIANAPSVTVYLDVVPRVTGSRALTQMSRQIDGFTAWIEVSRFDDVVELIGHEVEHVIEQIDGVDLAAGAAGIYSVSSTRTVFETERAARAGVTVAGEVRAAARRRL